MINKYEEIELEKIGGVLWFLHVLDTYCHRYICVFVPGKRTNIWRSQLLPILGGFTEDLKVPEADSLELSMASMVPRSWFLCRMGGWIPAKLVDSRGAARDWSPHFPVYFPWFSDTDWGYHFRPTAWFLRAISGKPCYLRCCILLHAMGETSMEISHAVLLRRSVKVIFSQSCDNLQWSQAWRVQFSGNVRVLEGICQYCSRHFYERTSLRPKECQIKLRLWKVSKRAFFPSDRVVCIYIYTHICWHSSDILSDIYSDPLPYILTFYLTHIPTFFLSLYLQVYLTFQVWHSFSHLIWHSIWHFIWYLIWRSIWHSIWQSIWHSIWHFIWQSLGHLIWHCVIDIWHSLWHWESIWYIWHSICWPAFESQLDVQI